MKNFFLQTVLFGCLLAFFFPREILGGIVRYLYWAWKVAEQKLVDIENEWKRRHGLPPDSVARPYPDGTQRIPPWEIDKEKKP